MRKLIATLILAGTVIIGAASTASAAPRAWLSFQACRTDMQFNDMNQIVQVRQVIYNTSDQKLDVYVPGSAILSVPAHSSYVAETPGLVLTGERFMDVLMRYEDGTEVTKRLFVSLRYCRTYGPFIRSDLAFTDADPAWNPVG